MIESAGNIQNRAIDRNNTRQKAEDAKPSGKDGSVRGAEIRQPTDELSISSRQAAQAEDTRPKQDPLEDADEASALIASFSDLLANNTGEARQAQANLDPEKVLELIA